MALFRQLFHLRKPTISRLDYLDIVIQDKMLFLISWQFPRKYRLKISKHHKTYFSASGSVVVKLPPYTKSIHLTVSSVWRKTKITVPLKKVALDPQTAKWLIQQFNPMLM